jgi:hypothetical protein
MSQFLPTTSEYQHFLEVIKQQILHSKHTAIRSVNRELISLYYEIGKHITLKQKETNR